MSERETLFAGRFRKRPVAIDAVRWDGKNWNALSGFLGAKSGGTLWNTKGESVLLRTLEGVMEAQPGDWIVRGIQGEFYPVKPDIFEQTYEALDA